METSPWSNYTYSRIKVVLACKRGRLMMAHVNIYFSRLPRQKNLWKTLQQCINCREKSFAVLEIRYFDSDGNMGSHSPHENYICPRLTARAKYRSQTGNVIPYSPLRIKITNNTGTLTWYFNLTRMPSNVTFDDVFGQWRKAKICHAFMQALSFR